MANENIKVISNREDIVAIADNIRTLTGVTGELTLAEMATAKGSGAGGNTDIEDAMATRTLTEYTNNRVTSIGNYAFTDCVNLTSVSFPEATSIGNSAFYYCNKLTSVSFPNVTSIGNSAFRSCPSLTSVSFPKATSIGSNAFYSCFKLTSIYLTNSTVCTLSNSNAFTSTPIGGYSARASTYGSIYVPASLLTAYKNATNWTYFSSRFVGI